MKMQGNEAGLKEALFAFKDLMDKHNIEFVLLYGALLGAYRNKRLLPWDVDIDVGIIFESYEDFVDADIFGLLRDAYKSGFRNVRFAHEFNVDRQYYKYPEIASLPENEQWREFLRIGHVHKYDYLGMLWRGVNLSLEQLENTDGWINIDCAPLIKGIHSLYYECGCQQLGKVELYGEVFNTPSDTLRYLSDYYGKNWQNVFCSYELWQKHHKTLRSGSIPQEVEDFMNKWKCLLED